MWGLAAVISREHSFKVGLLDSTTSGPAHCIPATLLIAVLGQLKLSCEVSTSDQRLVGNRRDIISTTQLIIIYIQF